MDLSKKMAILTLINEKKSILFGKFYGNLTFDMKVNAWKNIVEKLSEQGIYDKDWKYLRDTMAKLAKKDNRKKGSGRGKKLKFDDSDEIILTIIGKNTPVLDGLDVPESSGTQEAVQIQADEPGLLQDSRRESTSQASQNIQDTNGTYSLRNKSMFRLKREKLEADILLANERLELAKREKYRLNLELYRLEKDLNIRKISNYIETFHNQGIVEISLVNLTENDVDDQQSVVLERSPTV